MEPITAIIFLGLFATQNKEFIDTAVEQSKDGYTWQQIQCRQVNPELPAITIDTPTGKKLVCNKLTK